MHTSNKTISPVNSDFHFNSTNNSSVGSPVIFAAVGPAKIPAPSIVAMTMTAIGLLTNGLLLSLFIKDRSLRTPFNIYLINLLVANILSMIVVYPINVMDMLYPIWFLGDGACMFYQYGRFVVQAGIFNGHTLIAINRIWSVVHPYSYRLAHLRLRGPITVCLCMWIYVHVFTLPGLLPELIKRLLPVNGRRCFFTPILQSGFDVAVQFIIFDLPLFIMLSAFPVIFVARRIRRRFSLVHQSKDSESAPSDKINVATRGSRFSRLSLPADMQNSNPTRPSQDIAQQQTQPKDSGSRAKSTNKSTNGFLVLGLLTIGVSVCWAPPMTVFTINLFTPIQAPIFYHVTTAIFSFQTTLDPILFTLALRNVRDALRRLCGCNVVV